MYSMIEILFSVSVGIKSVKTVMTSKYFIECEFCHFKKAGLGTTVRLLPCDRFHGFKI